MAGKKRIAVPALPPPAAALRRSGTLCPVRADESCAEQIAWMIGVSFAAQAKELGLDRQSCPDYVAFETAADVRRDLAGGTRAYLFYLDGVPVATVRLHIGPDGRTGSIDRLAVLPQYRGRDLGARCVYFAEGALRALGAKKVRLSIVASFAKLESFYHRLGYATKEDKTYPGLPFTVRYLQKKLSR